MDNLLSPNIYLYIFYNQDEKYSQYDNPIWLRTEKILDYFQTNLDLKTKLDFSQSRRLLETEDYVSFNTQFPNIEGFFVPKVINDSYALLLNIGCPEDGELLTQNISILSKLNYNNSLIIRESSNTYEENLFLGETILITAYVQPNQENLQELATNYITELIGKKITCFQDGIFFGSPIFEYHYDQQMTTSPIIIVWLLSSKNSKTDYLFNKCQSSLNNLFFYKHKIIKNYQNGREIYGLLRKKGQEDKELFVVNSVNLITLQKQLETLLQKATAYTYLLLEHKYVQNGIDIHLYNYHKELKSIVKQTNGENIEFWETFSEEKFDIFVKQINADFDYCNPMTELFDRAIACISATVENERAQLEQKLENTIQSVGGGIAAGISAAGIAASCYPLIEEPWQKIFNIPFHPIIGSVGISLFVGIVGGVGVWWVIKNRVFNN